MSVVDNNSATVVKENNDGNFIVKHDEETIATCYTLEQALDIAATLLNRTQTNA